MPPKRRLYFTLTSMDSLFTGRTWGGFDGRFRFGNLTPGTYTLSIYIPDDGEILQTVDVTRSFAAAKGRIEKEFAFDEESLHAIIRPVPQSIVSARLLAISYKAKMEFQKAQGRLEARDPEGAIQHLERAIELAPTFSEALNSLGTIYCQQRRHEDADRCFREALEQDRDGYEPLVNLGGALEINLQEQDRQPNDPLVNA